MKNVFLALMFILFSLGLKAQRNYQICYDKVKDQFEYFELKTVKGKKQKIRLKNSLPKLAENDIVTVEVTNYNPYLYYVEIKDEFRTVSNGKKSMVGTVMNLLTTGLNPFSNFIGNLPNPSNFEPTTRGELPAGVVNNMEFEFFQKDYKEIKELIDNYQSKYLEFQNVIKRLEEEDLKSSKEAVLDILSKCNDEYMDITALMDALHHSAQDHFNRAGVTNKSHLSYLNQLNEVIHNFKEETYENHHIYSKDALNSLIHELKKQTFTCQQIFQIDKPEKFKIVDAENAEENPNEIRVGKLFVINFYRREEVKKNQIEYNPYNDIKFVKYFHPNKFWSPKGIVVDTFCVGCKPVVAAEGWLRGEIKRNIHEIYMPVSAEADPLASKASNTETGSIPLLIDDAVGDWLFYKPDGNLDFVSFGPKEEGVVDNKWKDYFKNDVLIEGTGLKSVQNRIVEFPLRGAINFSWSVGAYGIGSFTPRRKFTAEKIEGVDTTVIRGSEISNMVVSIGSQMDFQFLGNKYIVPSIGIGAAVDFWNNRDIHFLIGGGLRFKAFPYLSINAGISLTPVSVLKDNFTEGNRYSYFNVDPGDISKKIYQPGYFFSLNICI